MTREQVAIAFNETVQDICLPYSAALLDRSDARTGPLYFGIEGWTRSSIGLLQVPLNKIEVTVRAAHKIICRYSYRSLDPDNRRRLQRLVAWLVCVDKMIVRAELQNSLQNHM